LNSLFDQRRSEFFRFVGNAFSPHHHKLLAEVLAFEQTQECRGHILDALEYVLSDFELPGAVPVTCPGFSDRRIVERLAPESEGAMRKGRFTEEQMVAIIREADRDPVSEVAKRHGVSGAGRQGFTESFVKNDTPRHLPVDGGGTTMAIEPTPFSWPRATIR
jgi:hypothetical protein